MKKLLTIGAIIFLLSGCQPASPEGGKKEDETKDSTTKSDTLPEDKPAPTEDKPVPNEDKPDKSDKPKDDKPTEPSEKMDKKVLEEKLNKLFETFGPDVNLDSIEEQTWIYKVGVKAQGQTFNSYITKDGQLFFQTGNTLEEVMKQAEEAEKTRLAALVQKEKDLEEMPKLDKPEVEIFVMSHCPFGTQIEKGILPVLDKLGDKVDFKLKFCDYAMHDKKELDEQLNQYCIQKETPKKLTTYLKCFLKEGKGEECIKETGLDKDKIAKCTEKTDKEFKVTEGYEDKTTWASGRFPKFNVFKEDVEKYGIQGSPGLVINGKKAETGRDPKSLLDAICNGFKNKPAECDQEIEKSNPSPGFGFKEGTDPAASNATCG